MLGPVSDTGRAMMASLQQAIQKGMPIEQAITYVKSMATQGVAPMVDLYSMLNQFERLKQPVAQPPQGGTVRDQIAAAAAMRDRQEMMQRGLASMPTQRAPESPMEQGLGSVPVPAMENAQFAGGGIVAFGDGGPTNKRIDYTDPRSVLQSMTSDLEMDPTEYMVREATAQEEAYKRMGLGAAAKAREEQIARQQAEAEKYASTAAQGNLAQYFFDLAANAAKPGARFLSAAAAAAPGYGQRRTDIEERARGLKNAAQESQLKLLEAEELRKAGYLGEAAKKRLEARKQAIEVGSEIFKANNQKQVAEIYKRRDPTQTEIDRLTKIVATAPRYSAEYKDALERLQIIDPKQAAIQAKSDAAARRSKIDLYRDQIKGLDRQLEKGIGLTDEQRAAIEAKKDAIKREAQMVYDIDPTELVESPPAYNMGLENPLAPQQNVLMPQRGPTAGPINTPQMSDPLGIRR